MKTGQIILGLALVVGYSAATTAEQSCLQQLGTSQSEQLVKWCIESSPATHPPCNSENSCELIVSEIKRSCGFLKDAKKVPAYCLLTYPSNAPRA